jgi:hypothetical protein
MFLEALTSGSTWCSSGCCARTGFAVEHLVDLRRPLETRSPFLVAVVEAATMLVSRFHVR